MDTGARVLRIGVSAGTPTLAPSAARDPEGPLNSGNGMATAKVGAGRRPAAGARSLHDHSGKHVGLRHHKTANEAGEHDRMPEHEAQDRSLMPEPVGRPWRPPRSTGRRSFCP